MVDFCLATDRVLFFPVTPFDDDLNVELNVLEEHIGVRMAAQPGAVFAACGTGEFHTLSLDEYRSVVTSAVSTVESRVPVVTGAGGPLGHALAVAGIAAEEGADALLVMPSYLVRGPQDGLVAYIEAVATATSLPLIVYHRGNAQFTGPSAQRLFENPQVVGFKDGVGDLAVAQEHVRAAARAGRGDAIFFNGLPTAEMTQAAFDGIGIRYYSSAVFAMAPEIANAFHSAIRSGNQERQAALIDSFYSPLVALRDETPGFAISLIKTGLRLTGVPVGSVRPPLVDPTPEQTERLELILSAGRTIAE